MNEDIVFICVYVYCHGVMRFFFFSASLSLLLDICIWYSDEFETMRWLQPGYGSSFALPSERPPSLSGRPFFSIEESLVKATGYVHVYTMNADIGTKQWTNACLRLFRVSKVSHDQIFEAPDLGNWEELGFQESKRNKRTKCTRVGCPRLALQLRPASDNLTNNGWRSHRQSLWCRRRFTIITDIMARRDFWRLANLGPVMPYDPLGL